MWAADQPVIGVYPHVSGETSFRSLLRYHHRCGLSPRERGNLRPEYIASTEHCRVYPHVSGETVFDSRLSLCGRAWVYPHVSGETYGCLIPIRGLRVYPHVSGETVRFMRRSGACRGLSPRERGNHADSDWICATTVTGLSPRERGNRRTDNSHRKRLRSIPT